MLRILVLLVLLAPRAAAGAWPVPAGEGHLSVSVEGDRGDGTDAYSTLYLEHGLAGGRTAGLDLGLSEAEADKAVAFLRWHGGADDGTRLAYELGAGMVEDHAALRPGMSLGRGVAFGERAGWVALDTRAVLFDDMAARLEADLTVGGDAGTGDKWLVQVQMAAPSDSAPYVKLAPSYAFARGAGRHLRVGVTAGLVGFDDMKLELGLWQSF
jgi:hypothetical protein